MKKVNKIWFSLMSLFLLASFVIGVYCMLHELVYEGTLICMFSIIAFFIILEVLRYDRVQKKKLEESNDELKDEPISKPVFLGRFISDTVMLETEDTITKNMSLYIGDEICLTKDETFVKINYDDIIDFEITDDATIEIETDFEQVLVVGCTSKLKFKLLLDTLEKRCNFNDYE